VGELSPFIFYCQKAEERGIIMKGRRLSILLVFVLIFSLLAGCNNEVGKNSENNSSQDNIGAVSIEPTAPAVEATAGKTAESSYAYEQDLNIISDNYRNYYEIFVYSFYDSDGDGIGDINGVISKLDYIQDELGFNGIWLMPVMPSPTYHKYDVTDYYDIDQQYGTLEDFKKLSEECDKRDIKLIIDFVFNHTSAKHPWFKKAVSYLETLQEGEEPGPVACPSVEYYHFTRENNGSKSYYRAGTSDWYYEGVFWDQMPDLALESKALRGELEKIVKFWLNLGVDGFRLDAAKEYYTGDTPKNVEVLKWFSDYVTSVKPDAYIVGEVWDEQEAISNYYQSGVTSFFNFPLAQYDGLIVSTVRKLGSKSASSYAKNLITMQQKYTESNPDYIDAPFISNHDTTRISAMCMNDASLMKMSAGLLLMQSGNPFVYYGEEIGMNSKGDKDENKRLPMQWSRTDATGMTKGPADADTVEQKFPAVEEQKKDQSSLFNYYKRAIRIRNENPEIARGRISVIDALTNQDICAIEKLYQDSKLLLIYNINKEAATLDLEAAGYGKLAIRGYLTVDGSEVTLVDGKLTLPMYSIAILK
jgi:glycosidase